VAVQSNNVKIFALIQFSDILLDRLWSGPKASHSSAPFPRKLLLRFARSRQTPGHG
jgi:hypothetical protein